MISSLASPLCLMATMAVLVLYGCGRASAASITADEQLGEPRSLQEETIQQKPDLSRQVLLSLVEPRPIEAATLAAIKAGDTLSDVLKAINPNGCSAKFVMLRRCEDGEYLVLYACIRAPDRGTDVSHKADVFLVFRNSNLTGITTWQLSDIPSIFNANGNPVLRAMKISDSLISASKSNGVNLGVLSYYETIGTKIDPGLAIMAGVVNAVGVVLNNAKGADFIPLDRVLGIKVAKDLLTIDPEAEIKLKFAYSAEYLVSMAFVVSNSVLAAISSESTNDIELILGFGFCESLRIRPKR